MSLPLVQLDSPEETKNTAILLKEAVWTYWKRVCTGLILVVRIFQGSRVMPGGYQRGVCRKDELSGRMGRWGHTPTFRSLDASTGF